MPQSEKKNKKETLRDLNFIVIIGNALLFLGFFKVKNFIIRNHYQS